MWADALGDGYSKSFRAGAGCRRGLKAMQGKGQDQGVDHLLFGMEWPGKQGELDAVGNAQSAGEGRALKENGGT